MSRSLLAVFGLALMMGAAEARYNGDGTAYSGPGDKDATGHNACGFGELDSKWEKHYCALPSGMFSHGKCGQCVKVCGRKGCITAKVVDACASCGHGDIDLSTVTLSAATGFKWDRKAVTWSFVSCNGGDDEEERPRRSKRSRKDKKKSRRSKKSKKSKHH